MSELVTANWWLFLIALAIGILVAWWIFVASRRTKVERTPKRDVLDEGAERAKRNQALLEPIAPPPAEAPGALKEPSTIVAGGGAEIAMPEPEFAPSAEKDDLKRMKGVGPKLEKLLNELGVTSFAQIAAWSESDVERIDARLGTFQGRIRRDNWIEQAKYLSAGDVSGFQGKFGNL